MTTPQTKAQAERGRETGIELTNPPKGAFDVSLKYKVMAQYRNGRKTDSSGHSFCRHPACPKVQATYTKLGAWDGEYYIGGFCCAEHRLGAYGGDWTKIPTYNETKQFDFDEKPARS